MSNWPSDARSTKWRQGSLFPLADGLIVPESAFSHAVVVSQDCDIVAGPDLEPEIEFAYANLVDAENPSLVHAKNPRLLQVAIGNGRYVEIDARRRIRALKNTLPPSPPIGFIALEKLEISTMVRWLGRRYTRTAFPDEFMHRLKEKQDKLTKLTKMAAATAVSGVYLRLNPGNAELPADQDYQAEFLFACPSEYYDNPTRHAEAEEFALKFSRCVESCRGIILTGDVDVRPHREVTLEDLESYRRLDYEGRSIAGNAATPVDP